MAPDIRHRVFGNKGHGVRQMNHLLFKDRERRQLLGVFNEDKELIEICPGLETIVRQIVREVRAGIASRSDALLPVVREQYTDVGRLIDSDVQSLRQFLAGTPSQTSSEARPPVTNSELDPDITSAVCDAKRVRICWVCGSRFQYSRSSATYCSQACRQEGYRRRQRMTSKGPSNTPPERVT